MARKKNLHVVLVVLCRLVSNVLNKFKKQSCWVADCSLASQGKFYPLRNRNVHYRFHKNPWRFLTRIGTSWRFLAQARNQLNSSTDRFVVFCFYSVLYSALWRLCTNTVVMMEVSPWPRRFAWRWHETYFANSAP